MHLSTKRELFLLTCFLAEERLRDNFAGLLTILFESIRHIVKATSRPPPWRHYTTSSSPSGSITVSSLGHLPAFLTNIDPAGLERLLRLFQSFFMILTSYPSFITQLLPFSLPITHLRAEKTLFQLQGRLNITRRWLRTFRFLETLQTGWKCYMAPDKTLEIWLDAHSKTCLGLFGMLETVTLLDLIDVDHLEIFGRPQANKLNIDAQRFWFLGLYLSAMATGVRLIKILAFSPVPQADDFGAADEKTATSAEEKKKALQKKKEQKKQWAKNVSEQTTGLVLKLLADVLDLVIPASILGWVQVETGLVGIAMFCSSILTGLDVWRRCGREVAQKAK